MKTSDATLRRYLLGQLAEAEAEALEERYFGDADLLDELRAQEDHLLEAYLEQTLETGERQRVDEMLSGSADLRRRLQLLKSLESLEDAKERAPAPSWGARVLSWLWPESGSWPRRLAPVAGVAILIVGLTVSVGPSRDAEPDVLSLQPASLRSAAASDAAASGRALQLRLELPPDEPRGRFEVAAELDGRTVWQQRVLSTGPSIELTLPGDVAGAGLLVLTLRDESGAVIAFYELTLTKDPE
jgi:anti-sigma-K factor RskA